MKNTDVHWLKTQRKKPASKPEPQQPRVQDLDFRHNGKIVTVRATNVSRVGF